MSFPQAGVPEGTFPDGPDTGEVISDSDFIARAKANQSVTVDGQSYSEHSLNELIELDKYLNNRTKKNVNGWGSVAKSRVVPPGGNGNT